MGQRNVGHLILGGYMALGLAWSGLYLNRLVENYNEDKTAIAFTGEMLSDHRRYLAFDQSHDGQIDKIKEEGRTIFGGCRAIGVTLYENRYYPGSPLFDMLLIKYFTKGTQEPESIQR